MIILINKTHGNEKENKATEGQQAPQKIRRRKTDGLISSKLNAPKINL